MVLLRDKIVFLSKVFKDVQISRDNLEISVRCPECGKPGKSKLCIRLDNEIYHCWVCGIKGKSIARVVGLVSKEKKAQYSAKFPQSNTKKEVEKVKEIELPEDFKILAEPSKDPYYKEVMKYALSRGFNKSMLWRFRCGFSRKNKWYRRLLMPSFDVEGNLNYLTGRSIDANNNFRYINDSLPKEEIIFNEIDVDFSKPLVLVEGPLDLIKCIGINSTCLLGSTLNPDSKLFEKITRNQTPIILLLDSDAKTKAMKIAKLLASYSVSVRLNFPTSEDVGDCTNDEVISLIQNSKRFSSSSLLMAKLQGMRQ